MSVKMPDLKFTEEKTYFFCPFSTAKLLPENLRANGITDFKIYSMSKAREMKIIPESVHIPKDPTELEYRKGIPLRTLVTLCVLVSNIETESLKQYLPDIWDDYDEELNRRFSKKPIS